MTIKLYNEGAYTWQSEAHSIIDKNKGRVVVIKACRQIYGKTRFCLAELVRTCLSSPNLDCAYVSPTLQLAQENFEYLAARLQAAIVSSNGSTKKIRFINGSRISFFSAGQEHALRGFHCSGLLVVDECAYINDSVWTELIAAWVLKHKPTVIMISTPFFRDGFFWNNFNDPRNIVLDWTTKYPQPESDFLLQLKQTMPLRQYNCEYRGEWLEAEGSVFVDFKELLIEPTETDEPLYIGIDWASGSNNDETVLVGFNAANEMRLLRRWRNTPPMQQVGEICEVLRRTRPLKVLAEENAIGKIYLDALRRHVHVQGFNTTNDSKRRIIDNLRSLIERRAVRLWNDRELINQLVFYQEERTATGKITYNAAAGKHDDIVMAVAIALHAPNATSAIRII